MDGWVGAFVKIVLEYVSVSRYLETRYLSLPHNLQYKKIEGGG